MTKIRINLVGDKYGLLTVIGFNSFRIHGKNRQVPYWDCLCACGKTVAVKGAHLRHGDTKSCGCYKPNKLPIGEASLNYLLTNYKRHAKNRNITWALTKEEFKQLTSNNCYYCGAPPSQLVGGKRCNGKYVYNGIDRLNNEKEYNISTAVACCGTCNSMKSSQTYTEFINKLKTICQMHK